MPKLDHRRRTPWRSPLLPAVAALVLAACAAATPPPDPPAATAPSQPDAAAIAAVLDSVPGVSAAELEPRLAAPTAPVLLDVRSAAEYAAGHVPGARNLPHDQIAQRLAELPAARDQELIVYCRTGRRAAQALETLRRAGFTRLGHLRGDFQAWSAEGRPVAMPASVPTSSTPP